MKNRTDNTPEGVPDQAAPPAPLPTHGGVYEFDPATRQMRALDDAAAASDGGNGDGATTGEQA